jgi:glycosyltransferase involved in cell wall biosynthesis
MNLIAFFNGFNIKHVDGGSYHVFRVLRNWSKTSSISIVIPKIGYHTCKHLFDESHRVYLSSTDNEVPSGNINMIFAYLGRMIRSSFIKYDPSPDVIICSSHLLYDIAPALLLRRRVKARLVIYVHHIISQFRTGEQGFWSNISKMNEKLGIFLLRGADMIFAVNENVRSRLLAKGFDPSKIVVVGNGLDHDLINSVNPSSTIFEACFCGRLVERKGVYDLLYIWKQVIKKYPKSRLIILGDGQEYENLKNIVRLDQLEDNVILAGFVSDIEKIATLKSSRLFVFPSYEEGWGIVVTEAMACGVCVVAYDLPTYNVFGDSLARIEIGNKERMSQKIIELLENDVKRESYISIALDKAKSFDWDEISAQEYSQILKLQNEHNK